MNEIKEQHNEETKQALKVALSKLSKTSPCSEANIISAGSSSTEITEREIRENTSTTVRVTELYVRTLLLR